MSKIIAFKSDFDGKLFEFQADYTKHLRKLAAKRREEKKVKEAAMRFNDFMKELGQVKDIDELTQKIKDNWIVFKTNGRKHSMGDRFGKNDDNLLNLEIKLHSFDQKTSNSHSCPRGGVQNFDTRAEYNKGKPTSYPGWRCRITYSVTHSSGFGSSYFENTIINTGTGGGGDQRLSYELTLWAADFPVMWEQHSREAWIRNENFERQKVWRSLGGTGTPQEVTEIPEDWVVPDPMKS